MHIVTVARLRDVRAADCGKGCIRRNIYSYLKKIMPLLCVRILPRDKSRFRHGKSYFRLRKDLDISHIQFPVSYVLLKN